MLGQLLNNFATKPQGTSSYPLVTPMQVSTKRPAPLPLYTQFPRTTETKQNEKKIAKSLKNQPRPTCSSALVSARPITEQFRYKGTGDLLLPPSNSLAS